MHIHDSVRETFSISEAFESDVRRDWEKSLRATKKFRYNWPHECCTFDDLLDILGKIQNSGYFSQEILKKIILQISVFDSKESLAFAKDLNAAMSFCTNKFAKFNSFTLKYDYISLYTKKELEFITWHEFGHLKDFLEGRLNFDDNGAPRFDGETCVYEINKVHIAWETHGLEHARKLYTKLPHEASANAFAVQHVTTFNPRKIPVNFRFKYQVETGMEYYK